MLREFGVCYGEVKDMLKIKGDRMEREVSCILFFYSVLVL